MMQRSIIFGIMVFALVGIASAQTYQYYGTIIPSGTQTSMGGVALKADGDLYYVTFADASSELVYVDNAIPGALSAAYTVSSVATLALPAGRGLNDVEVDTNGDVYVSGTGGSSAAESQLVKFSAAPAHAQLWSMQSLAAGDQVRHNGIEVIGDYLAISEGFNSVTFKNKSDGTNTGTKISGDVPYQRSLAYNSLNEDIYAGKNGNSVSSTLNIFSGGSSSNPSGYSKVADNLLSDMGQTTTYGTATQPVDYDASNDWLIAADADDQSLPDDPSGVRIFSYTGSGASTAFSEEQAILERDGTVGYGNVMGVSYAKVTAVNPAEDFIAFCVATSDVAEASFVIELYHIPSGSVEGWNQY